MNLNKRKIFVALSGGVDSAVALYLLARIYDNVTAVYLNCWDKQSGCSSGQDQSDAVKIAGAVNVPIKILDLRDEYKKKVLQYFYQGYQSGITPNPDIYCNSTIKFGVLIDYILKQDKDALLATGHYARVSNNINEINDFYNKYSLKLNYLLMSGKDTGKDQSYFLYKLAGRDEILSRTLFPIGDLYKSDVRDMARKSEISVADKPDSQGICFIGNVKMPDFLKTNVRYFPGNVVNIKGDVIGAHSGCQLYTFGQRRGFVLKAYKSEPIYVIDKIVKSNLLVVGEKKYAYSSDFIIDGEELFTVLGKKNFDALSKAPVTVRIRNLGQKVPCTIKVLENSDARKVSTTNGTISELTLNINLKKPEFGISPGQSAVFYIGDVVLGGGEIKSVQTSYKKQITFGT
ncbi:tRNA 2-thiouridine(34) synthase MnmA [candidate division WWE3 bacterium RIFCSPLOWO2_01_FULL_39_13]|uniref:tRNA-specific 2-thiouridylase MnmA n=1 Tax=candidate division WWE3 bacterium RIFCSPLOWO2_01_FULL_39_13 TaxID=1802624 RepID=A0A1F4V1V3_UNCKA|nr:MAG: tRNA 2-thiouridine(34) synthase MnmA [candidate division WWE3 bacterium RIFCSPLOWO2_01_FULL_39_13]